MTFKKNRHLHPSCLAFPFPLLFWSPFFFLPVLLSQLPGCTLHGVCFAGVASPGAHFQLPAHGCWSPPRRAVAHNYGHQKIICLGDLSERSTGCPSGFEFPPFLSYFSRFYSNMPDSLSQQSFHLRLILEAAQTIARKFTKKGSFVSSIAVVMRDVFRDLQCCPFSWYHWCCFI